MAITPRIIGSDDVCRVAVWQNVAITDVAGDMQVAHMRGELAAAIATVREGYAPQAPARAAQR